jgi:drug/metabolite transporter (DMT)-like permease
MLAGEAVVVAGGTGLLVYEGFTAEVTSLVDALALAGFTALIAAVLAWLAFALSRRKPRARAPAIVLQLFGVVVAYFLVTAGLGWFSLPVAAAALSVITLLLTPATSAALAG